MSMLKDFIQLDEAGALHKLASKIGQIAGKSQVHKPGSLLKDIATSFTSAKAKASGNEEKIRRDASKADEALTHIASEALQAHASEVRYVLHLTYTAFKSDYLLSSGGGKVFATDRFSDEDLKIFLEDTEHNLTTLKRIKKNFKFSDLLPQSGEKQKSEVTVIIDVPKSLSDLLEAEGKKGIDNARAILVKMMGHKYYVMSLNNQKARHIASALDKTAGNLTDMAHTFDPDIIVNYPIKHTLTYAKNEWDALHNPVKPEEHNDEHDTKHDTEQSSEEEDGADTEETLEKKAHEAQAAQKSNKGIDAVELSARWKAAKEAGGEDAQKLEAEILKIAQQIKDEGEKGKMKFNPEFEA